MCSSTLFMLLFIFASLVSSCCLVKTTRFVVYMGMALGILGLALGWINASKSI